MLAERLGPGTRRVGPPAAASIPPPAAATQSLKVPTTHDRKAATVPPPITDRIRKDPPIDISRQLEPVLRYRELMWAPFREHHARLGGAPGAEVSGVESVHGGSRVHYQNGTIYQNPGGHTAWVIGLIGERYDQLAGPAGWLGFPLSDEQTLPDGGKVTVFDRGRIYFWDDVGAIDVNDVVVHYTGLHAFSETDGGGSDEPYAVIGVNSPAGQANARTQIYEDVDSGSTRPDLVELYRGKPDGVALTVLLMEHDEGDPEKYKALMDQVVEKKVARRSRAP